MGVVSAKLRDSARGQDCTLMFSGICNHDPETVVLAHLPTFGNRGMGIKADDINAVFACSSCHEALDNKRIAAPFGYMLRALQRTQKIWFEMGLLKIPLTERKRTAVTKIYPRKAS